jgi:predicted ATP-grasp superfamily ATP-dependent carboligase
VITGAVRFNDRQRGRLAGVRRTLEAIGLSLPPMKSQLEASDDPAAWLFKGTRSSAGLQVYPASERPTKLPGYFQQRIAGFSWSAAFVASAGRAHLLGIFEQLIGSDWYAPRPFQYAGNIGPLPFAQRDQVAKLGNELAAAFSLQGLFGLDFLLDGAERIWPLEVNPRYTASMELAERAHGGLSLAAAHVAACASREITWPANQEDRRACHGKGIVYAPADCAIPAALCQQLQEANANQPWPLWGDIPTAQSSVPAGAPVATALASAAAADAVRAELLERRSWLLRQITTSDE